MNNIDKIMQKHLLTEAEKDLCFFARYTLDTLSKCIYPYKSPGSIHCLFPYESRNSDIRFNDVYLEKNYDKIGKLGKDIKKMLSSGVISPQLKEAFLNLSRPSWERRSQGDEVYVKDLETQLKLGIPQNDQIFVKNMEKLAMALDTYSGAKAKMIKMASKLYKVSTNSMFSGADFEPNLEAAVKALKKFKIDMAGDNYEFSKDSSVISRSNFQGSGMDSDKFYSSNDYDNMLVVVVGKDAYPVRSYSTSVGWSY